MRQNIWGGVVLFVYGAIFGTALDAFHTLNNVERYPTPLLFGLIAWWVPLLFGAAALAIGISHPLIDPFLRNRRRGRGLLLSSVELIWLVLAYLLSIGPFANWIKAGLITLVYIAFWLSSGNGWQNLLLSAVTAGIGTGIEILLVTTGAFSYTQPDFAGVPCWLPCLYACASLAVGDLGRALRLRIVLPNQTHFLCM